MDELRNKIAEIYLEKYFLENDGLACDYDHWPLKDKLFQILLRCPDEDFIDDTKFSQLLEPTTIVEEKTNKETTHPDPVPVIETERPQPLEESPTRILTVTTETHQEPSNERAKHEAAIQARVAEPRTESPEKPQPLEESPTITKFSQSSEPTPVVEEKTNKETTHPDPVPVLIETKSPERPRPLEESPTRISKVVDRINRTPAVNTETHQEQIYERAKHEAAIQARIAELRKQGLWSAKRLPKLQEPPRPKTHWDFVLEEMRWLAGDFDGERRWKRKAAKKCALMVYRYHQEKRSKIERAEREHLQHIKKLAATQAKEIRNFWSYIDKLVEFRHKTQIAQVEEEASDRLFNLMLDQASKMTHASLEESTNDSTCLIETTNASITKDEDMDIDYLTSQDGDKDEIQPVIKSEEQADQQSKEKVEMIAAGAQSIQPKGNTLETTSVTTPVPFLLKHSLREYQHIGLDWLVAMYNKKLNGILADEMGLGKTIQTIALLAHLACEKGDWGPHLIVVPTSVMLNWEMEIKKWCPAFKILTYYGNPKERKLKRVGWSRPNSFHICITSYRIVIQDHAAFRRKKWTYFILDEAHYIKNFKSQRWQMLLNFNSQRRLLLTGTPLQNDLMELWSLMHFLMPAFFDSYRGFKDWFVNPLTDMVEGNQEYSEKLVASLHRVLRPFLLRRLKCDVEKQLPRKREFIKTCRLSKRQRFLYEEFMSLSKTKETLASGSFLSVINVLMQLRKVCNHPNLFEPRPTISPLMMKSIAYKVPGIVTTAVDYDPYKNVNLESLRLLLIQNGESLTSTDAKNLKSRVIPPTKFVEEIMSENDKDNDSVMNSEGSTIEEVDPSQELIKSEKIEEAYVLIKAQRKEQKKSRLEFLSNINYDRCTKSFSPYYKDLQDRLTLTQPDHMIDPDNVNANEFSNGNGRIICSSIGKLRGNPRLRLQHLTKCIDEAINNPEQIVNRMSDIIDRFVFCVPSASAPRIKMHVSHAKPSKEIKETYLQQTFYEQLSPGFNFLNKIIINMKTSFPELRLIEYDCGKLQTLGRLLTELKSGDHRVLIFTQMSRMLDILEQFLNYHGHTYLRLDGATKIDQRQILMERFNNDRKIFCFILSTRSGGIGVNLTGADTVIFYDSDWNPTMDAQAQDRCHRIGQTKDVHIYRLISEDTIEKNIFMKAQQKRMLGDLAIEDGNFNNSSLKRNAIQDLFDVKKDSESFELDKVTEVTRSTEMTKADINKLEQALSKGEAEAGENVDVDAIEQARADDNTDLREFDENIPITEESSPIIEKSEKEQEIDRLVSELTPVQQFALRFKESEEEPKNNEELEQVKLGRSIELENKKLQWEQSRIEQLKDQAIQNETNETVLTYPRGAKCERVHYMLDGEKEVDELPLWAPPTPPTSPPSPVEETNSQPHYQPSMTPAMAARINAMGGLANIFGFGSESNSKDVKNFIDEKDLYVDFTHHFLYEPSVMTESQLPPVNQDYTENEPTSYTIGTKKIRLTGTPVDTSGYFQPNSTVSMPHLQHHLQNLTNIQSTPDGILNSAAIGQQVARKPKVRRDEVICLPKSIFDRQTPNFAKIRRELKLQKLRCVTKGNDSDPFAMQKFFHSFSLNPLGQSLQQDSIVTQVNRQIQQFNDSRILLAYHQDQLPPWTIQEEWALLLVIQHLQDVPVNLCILTPGHTPNWELTSEVVSDIGFTYRSFKMCEYHFAFEVQKREMTRDSSWDERAVQSLSHTQPQPPPAKKAKKNKLSLSSQPNNNDSHLGPTAGSDASQSSSKSSSVTATQTSSASAHSTIPFKPSKTGAILAGDKSLQLSFGERYEIIARIRQNRPRLSSNSRYGLNQGLRNRTAHNSASLASGATTPAPQTSSMILNNDNFRCLKPEAVIAEAAEQRKRQAYANQVANQHARTTMVLGRS